MALLWPLINLSQLLVILAWNVVWISLAAVGTLFTWNPDTALVFARRYYSGPIIKVLGGKVIRSPLPEVDWSRPHIYLMNHQSAVDIPLAFNVIPANLRFVAKHSLKWVPFLGWYMQMTRMIFVNRSRRREAIRSLRQAGERIREGANIIAFPEGTRSRDGALLPFKKGVFVLAIESGVPIIPVVALGTGQLVPPDSLRARPTTVKVVLGKPIETLPFRGQGPVPLMEELRKQMLLLQESLQDTRPDGADEELPSPQRQVG